MPMKRLTDRLKQWRLQYQRSTTETEIEYVSLSDLPTWEELERRSITWPVGYRIMLNTQPLQGHDLYVEREQSQQALEETLQRWHDGFAPMLALVGPNGCGRSTLLNWFETHLPIGETVTRLDAQHRLRTELDLLDWLCREFNLNDTVSNIDELIAALNALPARIVILDDLQRLLLRAMGTAAVVHALLSILLGTQKHLFWVVSCREYSWRLLNDQFGLSRYFYPVVQLGYFRQEQLRQALELRLGASELKATIEGSEEETEETLLNNRHLQGYISAAAGNMRAALFYWQLYTYYDEEQQQLQLRKGKRVELSTLRNRGDLDLFSLAEVITNGGLSVREHAEIFQREPLKSRVVLEHLHQLRLLERSDTEHGEPFYQLDPVFFLPVTAMLEAAHVLY